MNTMFGTHHVEWPGGHRVVCYCQVGRDHKRGDGCDGCGEPAPEDELYECALSVPWQPAERHCIVCFVDCGPCRDESAREWQDEHGIRSGRRV